MKLKETRVTVTEVINGDTFKVSPRWHSTGNEEGDTIKINGFTNPDESKAGSVDAKQTLESIILNKSVELRNPIKATQGQLMCDVAMDGKNITTLMKR